MAWTTDLYPLSISRDEKGGMSLGGYSLDLLAHDYKTPLYVFDAQTVYHQVEVLRRGLERAYQGEAEITYAAKAYFSLGMARKLASLTLGVDVVSLSELLIAQRAGFEPGRVHLHGNNKGQEELDASIAWGVQAIVVDSLEELSYVESRAAEAGKEARIWLRITPGLSVDTHPYRQTAHAASKFGLAIQDGSAAEGIRQALSSPRLKLTGLHTHLGSQVFEAAPYGRAIQMLMDTAAGCGFVPEELSPGGGWGVPYTLEDEPGNPGEWLQVIGQSLSAECNQRGFPLPKLIIEPGRWVVGRAGMAIYTIGTHKTTADGTRTVAVDGGMADNLRPALYHAVYSAAIAERPDEPGGQTYRVVGKFCESGDELIAKVVLPEPKRGEHLVIPVSGAYHLSMASNYNLAPRPAVLWVDGGRIEVLQPREEAHEARWWIQEGSGG